MIALQKKLREGEVVLGQMILELFTPGIGPMLAACGLEFVIYDMEHGRCDIGLLAEMVASCRGVPRAADQLHTPLGYSGNPSVGSP